MFLINATLDFFEQYLYRSQDALGMVPWFAGGRPARYRMPKLFSGVS